MVALKESSGRSSLINVIKWSAFSIDFLREENLKAIYPFCWSGARMSVRALGSVVESQDNGVYVWDEENCSLYSIE